jgi:hypothetical protein
MNRLPINGATLLDMRKRKERPAGVTLISLVGFLSPYSNFQLCAEPDDVYDWSPIAGLEVEVIASKTVPFASLLRQLSAIGLATPAHMALGFTEGPRVDCGEARYALQTVNPNTGRMLFDWFPMAVTTERFSANAAFADAMKIEKRLWAELGNSISIPFNTAEERIVKRMKKDAA